jgi:hypothetical protein
MHDNLRLYKVTKVVEGYTMVIAYSEEHAAKIARTLDDDQFAPVANYSATEITESAAIPEDWRELEPWPEHGTQYFRGGTCEEALRHLATRRHEDRVLAVHHHKCAHCDADLTAAPTQFHLSPGDDGTEQLRPFCVRCSEILYQAAPPDEV